MSGLFVLFYSSLFQRVWNAFFTFLLTAPQNIVHYRESHTADWICVEIWLFVFPYFFTEKKPKPENIDIYTLKITSDRRCKVVKMTLADVWKHGCIIRINNFGDKDKTPHSEKDIKNQVRLIFEKETVYQISPENSIDFFFVNRKNIEWPD